jgi:hypothetical protein
MCWEQVGQGGGYIKVVSDCFFKGEPENIKTYVDIAKEFRYYEIHHFPVNYEAGILQGIVIKFSFGWVPLLIGIWMQSELGGME